MDIEELLAQLADIHLPEPVSFWPPAPGWWVLAALVLALAAYLAAKYYQYYKKRKTCDFALRELDQAYQHYAQRENGAEDHQSDQEQGKLEFVNQFNAVLRRVALWHFPQSNVASLGGQAWVDFIREKGDSSLLTDEIANALSKGRFQTRCEVDVDALNSLGHQWISSLYMGRKNERPTPMGQSNDENTGAGGDAHESNRVSL